MWVTSSPATALTPTAVALGNFDGIHRGHQQVIQPILKSRGVSQTIATPSPSPELGLPNKSPDFVKTTAGETESSYSTVVTFNPHPREFFSGQRQLVLTPLAEKVKQLEVLGVEQLVLLPFDRELAELSPQQFVVNILVEQLRATRVSVGKDFCFGRRRAGTSEDLQAIAAAYGIDVTIVGLETCQGDRISSSDIRTALQEGKVEDANRLLGRPYTLTGTVSSGQQLGRTIGFPTANLQLPPEKFLPRQGVYAVEASSSLTLSAAHPAVMNIGQRPTINGVGYTIEVHLLDWSGDLYGQTLTVSLEKFLRPEQKFASLDELKAQIQADCDTARVILETGG
ncbi:MAG: bifunctional riboflavin kinase/FAD synthetase [Kastovskya adunca ATA6-11-RM4]|nr:bifunctional riboflavin kinase/FAD synthetase [Kastovskya adunca ATA6-11-RM4]